MPPKRKKDFPCLKCDEHVAKNVEAIECYLCKQWLHKSCSDVSDAVFKFLEQQVEYQGGTFWACQACRVVAIKFDKRMKEVDQRINQVEETANTNKADIKTLQDDLAALRAENTKAAPALDTVQAATKSSVFTEISDRDKRKLNVVVHGLGEADVALKDGKARSLHDMAKLQELLEEIQVQIDTSDRDIVKFSKRLGQAADGTNRPLLVGFSSADEVDDVIAAAKTLRTKAAPWKDKSIVRDLTAMQREEEKKMIAEAEKLTTDQNEDDGKKFKFKVVGPRGNKRIAKVQLTPEEIAAKQRM